MPIFVPFFFDTHSRHIFCHYLKHDFLIISYNVKREREKMAALILIKNKMRLLML